MNKGDAALVMKILDDLAEEGLEVNNITYESGKQGIEMELSALHRLFIRFLEEKGLKRVS